MEGQSEELRARKRIAHHSVIAPREKAAAPNKIWSIRVLYPKKQLAKKGWGLSGSLPDNTKRPHSDFSPFFSCFPPYGRLSIYDFNTRNTKIDEIS